MAARDSQLHKDHRLRVKKKFREQGLEPFDDHQILELALFYAIPQGDTNELAHLLINGCGGHSSGVFDSSYRHLLSFSGIGEHAATFLTLIPQLSSYYASSKQIIANSVPLKELQIVCKFFEALYAGTLKEEIHAAAMTDDLKVIRERKIAEGVQDHVLISPRALMDFANECSCTRLIIAHNHPLGNFTASPGDISATRRLVKMFREFGIEIVDHIIVSSAGSISMRSSISSSSIWTEDEDNDDPIYF